MVEKTCLLQITNTLKDYITYMYSEDHTQSIGN